MEYIKKNIVLIIACVIVFVLFVLSLTLDNYVACGCGACDTNNIKTSFTFDPNKVISEDESIAKSKICSQLGCGICTKYYYFKFLK
jgi:hypothetical protein